MGIGFDWHDRSAVFKDGVAASAAAAFAKSFSTPVDRLKLYMACQDVSAPTPYRGLWDAARDMTSKFGVTALWRGHPGVLIRYIPSQVLNFVVFCALAPRLGLHDQLPGRRRAAHGAQPTTLHPVLSAATAGAAASACTLALTYPTSVARGALVADRVKAAKESTGNGLRSGFAGLVRELQLPLRFRNFGPSLAVVVPYRTVSFGLYFGYRERVHRYCHSAWSVAAASWLLAQGATAAGHLVSYPADTVRRRYLMQQHRPEPEWRYQTAAACWRGIATQEGAAGFFKGAGVSAVGSSLVGALVLVGFDALRVQMGAERDATEASASDV